LSEKIQSKLSQTRNTPRNEMPLQTVNRSERTHEGSNLCLWVSYMGFSGLLL